MSEAIQQADDWKITPKIWITALVVMIAPFMEVLDTSIANVSLPHMQGTFSATSDEILWVITSYLVANGIIIPTTAWLSSFFGRKKFLLACIVMFTAASALCGAATSLPVLVLARTIQGAGGGAMLPISQAILLENFPPSKRGMGMAIFGLGVIVAPIIGPVLGGWITDNFSWRWIFYINIPIGLLALYFLNIFIEDPSYAKKSVPKKIDYIGFSALALWLATLQVILDKGQTLDWFNSSFICILSVISIIAMIFFFAWESKFEHPIVDLSIFKDINFSLGSFLIMILGALLFGTIAILPMFLQTLMGYPALQSGLSIAPRGIGSLLAMSFAGFFSDKIDIKIQIAFGFGMLALANFMLSIINFQISPASIIIPNIISGIAMSFLFIPLSTAAFTTLKKEQIGNATGLFNMMRNIGGGFGISIIGTMLAKNAQIHQSYMVSHLNPTNPVFQEKIHSAKTFFMNYYDPHTASIKANGLVYSQLIKQSHLWAYVDNFKAFGILCICVIPTVLFFKGLKPGQIKANKGIH